MLICLRVLKILVVRCVQNSSSLLPLIPYNETVGEHIPVYQSTDNEVSWGLWTVFDYKVQPWDSNWSVSHPTFDTDRQCFHIWEYTCDLMKRASSIWKDNDNLREPIERISYYIFNFNTYFIFCVSIVSVWVCVCIYACEHVKRPEDGVWSPENGVTSTCEPPEMGLETKFWIFKRVKSTLNHWSISLVPHYNFIDNYYSINVIFLRFLFHLYSRFIQCHPS